MTTDRSGSMTSEDDPSHASDRPLRQAAQRHFDPAEEELTTALVFAIAESAGVAPSELTTPLYDSIDAPALEATLFGPDTNLESRQGVGSVEFRYTDYVVKVRSDGWIQVYEPTGSETP